MSLDHGWCTSAGHQVVADVFDFRKSFDAHVQVLCDFCRHGWVEDVRWRAEPVLLAIAGRLSKQVPNEQLSTLARWAELTALLAEHVEGMPRAACCGRSRVPERSARLGQQRLQHVEQPVAQFQATDDQVRQERICPVVDQGGPVYATGVQTGRCSDRNGGR